MPDAPRAPHPDTPVPLHRRDDDIRLRDGLAAVRDLVSAAGDLHGVNPQQFATLLDTLLTAGPQPG